MLSRWIVRFTGIAALSLAVCAAATAQYGGGGGTGGSGGTGGNGGYTAPPGGYEQSMMNDGGVFRALMLVIWVAIDVSLFLNVAVPSVAPPSCFHRVVNPRHVSICA